MEALAVREKKVGLATGASLDAIGIEECVITERQLDESNSPYKVSLEMPNRGCKLSALLQDQGTYEVMDYRVTQKGESGIWSN